MSVPLTAEAQLSLNEHNIAKEPQKHRNAKKPAANYAELPKSLVFTLLCIHKRALSFRERGNVLYLGMAQEFWDFAKLAIAWHGLTLYQP